MRSEFLSPQDRYKLLYKKQELFEQEMQQKRQKKEADVKI